MMKMRVPLEEANEYVEMMGESHMGYLFENFEEGDIQKERRKTEEAKAEAEAAKQREEAANKRAEDAEQRAENAEQKAEDAKYKTYILACQDFGCTKEKTATKLMEKYQLSQEETKEKVENYWEEK